MVHPSSRHDLMRDATAFALIRARSQPFQPADILGGPFVAGITMPSRAQPAQPGSGRPGDGENRSDAGRLPGLLAIQGRDPWSWRAAPRFGLSEPRQLTLKGVVEPVEVRSVDWR